MGNVIVSIIVLVVLALLVGLFCMANSKDRDDIYVYPKTNNQYIVKCVVKMKDTLSGEWIDAVLYISLMTGQYYVRDKRQFLDKFITLKEWEESNNGNVKSR